MKGVSKAVLVLVLVLLSITIVFSVTGLALGWEQFHQGVAHLGYQPGKAPLDNTFLWYSENIGAVPQSSLVVAEGLVFVNCDTNFVALHVEDGTEAWTVPGRGDYKAYSSWSGPAYHDGKVFLPGYGARRASDGSPAWPEGVTLPYNVNGCPTVAEGLVFQGDYDGAQGNYPDDFNGHYFAFDENTGAQVWKFDCDDCGIAQGTPAYDNGMVFLTAYDWSWSGPGYLYCVNAKTGNLIWRQQYELSLCGSPTVSDGVVYFTTYNFYGWGALYAVDESTGATKWSKTIERTDSTPAVANGFVYVCGGCIGYSNEGQRTYCFSATSGALIWQTPLDVNAGVWENSPAVADQNTPSVNDDVVFVGKPGTETGMNFASEGIYCLDAIDGRPIWQGPLGGSSPTIVGGIVYTQDDGRVYAFGTPSSDEMPTATPTATPTEDPSATVDPSATIEPSASPEPTPVLVPADTAVPHQSGPGTVATPTPYPEDSPTPSPSPSPTEEPDGILLWAAAAGSFVASVSATVIIMYVLMNRRKIS